MEASAAVKRNKSRVNGDVDNLADALDGLSFDGVSSQSSRLAASAFRGAEDELEAEAARKIGPNANVFEIAGREPDMHELQQVSYIQYCE
jgi:hypothetical protein